MAKFALVSKVDSMGTDFPGHCVMLFETEEEAVKHAVQVIKTFETDGDVRFGEDDWTDEEYLEAWQETLSVTEFFHVMPIVPSTIE